MAKNAKNKSGKDKGKDAGGGTIALNKRARHDYHLEQRFEAERAGETAELAHLGGRQRTERVRQAPWCVFGVRVSHQIATQGWSVVAAVIAR